MLDEAACKKIVTDWLAERNLNERATIDDSLTRFDGKKYVFEVFVTIYFLKNRFGRFVVDANSAEILTFEKNKSRYEQIRAKLEQFSKAYRPEFVIEQIIQEEGFKNSLSELEDINFQDKLAEPDRNQLARRGAGLFETLFMRDVSLDELKRQIPHAIVAVLDKQDLPIIYTPDERNVEKRIDEFSARRGTPVTSSERLAIKELALAIACRRECKVVVPEEDADDAIKVYLALLNLAECQFKQNVAIPSYNEIAEDVWPIIDMPYTRLFWPEWICEFILGMAIHSYARLNYNSKVGRLCHECEKENRIEWGTDRCGYCGKWTCKEHSVKDDDLIRCVSCHKLK